MKLWNSKRKVPRGPFFVKSDEINDYLVKYNLVVIRDGVCARYVDTCMQEQYSLQARNGQYEIAYLKTIKVARFKGFSK